MIEVPVPDEPGKPISLRFDKDGKVSFDQTRLGEALPLAQAWFATASQK